MSGQKILGVSVDKLSKNEILEKIVKYQKHPTGFFHIVSLNPENLVIAQKNDEFRKAIETAQIKIPDGVGIVTAAQILSVQLGDRLTGADLAHELINWAGESRLRVLMIGGRPNLALQLAGCYNGRYPQARFLGTIGFSDIKKPQKKEEEELYSIVRHYKPHIILAAFGSPSQELWFYRNQKRLNGIICMGVGGAFDYFIGSVIRAPSFFRKIGLEWLFRLIVQPWRWKRQRRLLIFIWLIIVEKWKMKF